MLKFLVVFIFGTSAMFLSCSEMDVDSSKDPSIEHEKAMLSLLNSNLPKISLENEYGHNAFDLSTFEKGDFSKIQGFMTVRNKVYPTNLSLSNDYLSGICYKEVSRGTFNVLNVNDGSETSISIKEQNNGDVSLDLENGSGTYRFVLSGTTLANELLNLEGNSNCNVDTRWIPFAIAAVGAAATIACAWANSNASADCLAVAQMCTNGVQTYEYEGGLCGNGDCNVVCNPQ